ncbi:hypothetical protein ACLMJK_006348 [Lecanora helva]
MRWCHFFTAGCQVVILACAASLPPNSFRLSLPDPQNLTSLFLQQLRNLTTALHDAHGLPEDPSVYRFSSPTSFYVNFTRFGNAIPLDKIEEILEAADQDYEVNFWRILSGEARITEDRVYADHEGTFRMVLDTVEGHPLTWDDWRKVWFDAIGDFYEMFDLMELDFRILQEHSRRSLGTGYVRQV